MVLRAVFFDLDDTLALTSKHDARAFDVVEQEISKTCANADAAKVIADFKVKLKKQPWDPGYPDESVPVDKHRASLWAAALGMQGEQIGVSVDLDMLGARLQKTFDEERLSVFTMVGGASDLIFRLRSRGLAVVLITNGHHAIQRAKIDACKAVELFGDGMILVGGEELQAGRKEKPDPNIFHRACIIAGCKQSEAVMVGDSLLTDIRGAGLAGLGASIWINPQAKRHGSDLTAPTAHIPSVLDLESALSDIGLL